MPVGQTISPWTPRTTVKPDAVAALTTPTRPGGFDPLRTAAVGNAAQAALGGTQTQTTTTPVNLGLGSTGNVTTTAKQSPITPETLMGVGLADYQAASQAVEYRRNVLVPQAQQVLTNLAGDVTAGVAAAGQTARTQTAKAVDTGREKVAVADQQTRADADALKARADQMRGEGLLAVSAWAGKTLKEFTDTTALQAGQRVEGLMAATRTKMQQLDAMAASGAGGVTRETVATAKQMLQDQLSAGMGQSMSELGISWNAQKANLGAQLTNTIAQVHTAMAGMVEGAYGQAANLSAQMADATRQFESMAVSQQSMQEQGILSASIAAEQMRMTIGNEQANLIMSPANQAWAGTLLPLFDGLYNLFQSDTLPQATAGMMGGAVRGTGGVAGGAKLGKGGSVSKQQPEGAVYDPNHIESLYAN